MNNPNPRFHDSKGQLTPYSLACGYIQHYGKDISVTLYAEHGVYHVRVHNHITGHRVSWESFARLNEARKAYNQAKRKYAL